MRKVLNYIKSGRGIKMKLNKQKFEEILAKKWINGCPMCGGKNWSYDENLITTPIQLTENIGLNLGGKVLPLIAVCCENCGCTIFVNGKTINVLDGLEDTQEQKNENTK